MTRHGMNEVVGWIALLPPRGFTALAWLVALVTLAVTAPGLGR